MRNCIISYYSNIYIYIYIYSTYYESMLHDLSLYIYIYSYNTLISKL